MPVIEMPRDGNTDTEAHPDTNAKNIRALMQHINILEEGLKQAHAQIEVANNNALTAQNLVQQNQQQIAALQAQVRATNAAGGTGATTPTG